MDDWFRQRISVCGSRSSKQSGLSSCLVTFFWLLSASSPAGLLATSRDRTEDGSHAERVQLEADFPV